MSFPGDLWSSVNRIASQAKMNLKNNLVGTGDQILAKSAGSLQVGQIASVTTASTGGALQPGIVRWTGSAWVSPQGGIHTHTSSGDGGTFQDLLLQAIENVWYATLPGAALGNFATSGTGGTYANVISGTSKYVEITSGATSSNSGNLHYGGIALSFAAKSAFTTRILLASTTTSSQARCGMNMETASAATDNKPKYGFEGCTGCNSSSMSIISADGTTRSKVITSTDNYATVGNFIMAATPGPGNDIKYRKEGGSIILKNTNVPATGTSDRSNTWLCGIQTTTAAARTLQLYGFDAVGTKETPWPVTMTTYSNDPVRVKITLDDIWKLTHKPGIDSTFHPSLEQPDEFYLKLVTNSINPHSPQQENYNEDIERELSKLNIIQDHIRERKPHTYFNNCGPNRTVETIVDEKVFGKDNRYDILLDRFEKTVHLLPNGKRFITVEDS